MGPTWLPFEMAVAAERGVYPSARGQVVTRVLVSALWASSGRAPVAGLLTTARALSHRPTARLQSNSWLAGVATVEGTIQVRHGCREGPISKAKEPWVGSSLPV